ncbi:MAG TPA: sulfotransferase, partial [Dehalococcoidia bacterium]|nr:sulfotransferase [Dehalococcoidia bacterium]
MSARLPNFCIIGAQKSGTTSLAYYLRAHPDVFLAPGKEVHYFNANFEKGTEWYKSRFAGAGKQKAVGDATPNYLAHPQAPARMAGVIPDAK